MKKNYFMIIWLIVFLLFVFLIIFLSKVTVNDDYVANRVCFSSDCFKVELVSTYEDRQRGLMFRESLDEDRGMLFIWDEEGIYPFWMKNTLIPLDMIWIDENKKIVYIEKNVQPCEADPCPSYNPDVEALYVLEINAGISDEIGLKVGGVAEFYLK